MEDVLEIYKSVLSGKLKRFPALFWKCKGLENAKICLTYLMENILGWDEYMLIENLNYKVFHQYKLGGMFFYCFNNSSFAVVDFLYPNRFKPWQLKKSLTPKHYWDQNTSRAAVEWLIETHFTDSKVKNIDTQLFIDYGLGGMLQKYYSNSVNLAINDACCNKYKPWEIGSVSKGYWNKENIVAAVIWLFEEKLKWNNQDIRNNLDSKIFAEHGLGGMYNIICSRYSMFEIFNLAFPNRFKPWEVQSLPSSYWQRDISQDAVRWLVQEKIKLDEKNYSYKLTRKDFSKYRLRSMFNLVYNNSSYAALQDAFPGKYQPWERTSAPNNYWNESTCKQAIEWLVFEKLKCTIDEAKLNITKDDFKRYGLYNLLLKYFSLDVKKALSFIE